MYYIVSAINASLVENEAKDPLAMKENNGALWFSKPQRSLRSNGSFRVPYNAVHALIGEYIENPLRWMDQY